MHYIHIGMLLFSPMINIIECFKCRLLFNQICDDIIDLRRDARFAEQLRYLLNKRSGKVPLSQLNDLILADFGVSWCPNVPVSELRAYCTNIASHVASCTMSGCLVWAPSAHPYPPRRRNIGLGGTTAPAVTMEPIPSCSWIEPALPQQSPLESAVRGAAASTQGQDVIECAQLLSNLVQVDLSELDRKIKDLHTIKDSATGELDVDKLDPFLDYFVEVTNRVLASCKLQKPIAKPRSKLACQFSGRTSDSIKVDAQRPKQ